MYKASIFLATRIVLWFAGILGCLLYKTLTKKYQLIIVYILLALSIDCFAFLLKKNALYNLFLLPVYSFIELAIFSKVYKDYFIKDYRLLLNVFTVFIHSLILLDVAFLCDFFNAKTFYAFSKVITDIGIITFCLLYYWKSLKEDQIINKELLLLNAGFLCYFSINLLIFLSMNFLINASLHLVDPFWILNALSALFLYLFLIYMIWRYGRNPKLSHSGLQ